jgi:hypothetical protein
MTACRSALSIDTLHLGILFVRVRPRTVRLTGGCTIRGTRNDPVLIYSHEPDGLTVLMSVPLSQKGNIPSGARRNKIMRSSRVKEPHMCNPRHWPVHGFSPGSEIDGGFAIALMLADDIFQLDLVTSVNGNIDGERQPI